MFSVLLLIVISNFIFVDAASCNDNVCKIGILSVREENDNLTDVWGPTIDYLSEAVPGAQFVIMPLHYDNFSTAVEKGEVDFFYSNPMLYMEMERNYGASRLATIYPLWNNTSYSGLGGVIFTRADRNDINYERDLRGKSFMAVDEHSFGGFLAAMGELRINRVETDDFETIEFGETHDDVVLAVLNGEVDAGTVKTGVLERMALEGQIDLREIKVIGQKEPENYPFLVSTTLYPDWVFAKTKATSDNISKNVTIALLVLPPDSAPLKAMGLEGWNVPPDYTSIDNLMRVMRVDPYENYGVVTLTDMFIQHWYILTLIILVFILMEVHSRLMVEKANKSRLEISNKLKDLFTDIMRHDLLNPAGVIKGLTEMLYYEEKDAAKKESLKMINDQTDHLMSMIASAAKLAKLESYEEMEFSVQDVGPILAVVADSFSPEFERKGMKLEINIHGYYYSRVNDVIEDVFSNLLSNALKYSPQGSTVKVEIKDLGRSFKVMVTDQGEGIPDDVKPLIFDRFKRADKKGIKGTGLGLAIVQRIVQVHKGQVGVDDNPGGQGSVFWVILDRA